jgi:hypothetical protein
MSDVAMTVTHAALHSDITCEAHAAAIAAVVLTAASLSGELTLWSFADIEKR